MRIELAGWESSGLRCPDVSVDLRRDGHVPRVSLIQMPNGTGKTTTLNLLNATLSGTATNWLPEKIRSFRRSSDSMSSGRFKVTLLVDNKPLTIELKLNYDAGKVGYRSTSPGSGGVVPRWHVPPSVNRFLRPEFLELFVFDGEFAGRLLDGNLAEADRVVDALCQMYLLEEVSHFSEEYWRNWAKDQSTKTSSGLTRLERVRDKLESRAKELGIALSSAQSEAQVLDGEIRALDEKIEMRLSSVESTKQQHERSRVELESAKSQVRVDSAALMDSLRLPYAVHPSFASQLIDLRDNLDRLKLPENTSAQFFHELLCEDQCICGRPMDEQSVSAIEERAKKYLDEEDAGLINAVKKDIEQFANLESESSEDTGFERVKRHQSVLTDSLRREKTAEQQVEALRQQLIDAGDEELAEWQDKLEKKTGRHEQLKELIDLIQGPGDVDELADSTMSISLVRKLLEEKNGQIAKAKGTVKLREQTKLIKRIIDESIDRARKRIKQELLSECNIRLANILVNDPLTIDEIDRSIRLVRQEGASAGQTLSIGYTFLMSVLNRGQNDFPLVVDSPAGPIDEGVRRRIGRLIPSLCTQFVGFTINTERVGFVDSLEASVDDITFLTLFRKTSGTKHMMKDLPGGRYSETDSGVLVDDREYFFRFDIRDEEDDSHVI